MQVPALGPDPSLLAPLSLATAVRVVAGNLAAIPIGQLVSATVTSVANGNATLQVNGQAVTVRPAAGLQPGAILLARAPGGSEPTLELVGRAANPSPTDSFQVPGRVALVDVLSIRPDGRALIRIDNQEESIAAGEDLAVGGRYVAQIEQTPTGLTLRQPTDRGNLSNIVAGAVLRAAQPPNLGALLAPLFAELAALEHGESGKSPAFQEAANAVQDAIASFVDQDGQPPNADQLQRLVEDGGLHYESKLSGFDAKDDIRTAVRSDLKGALLQLLQVARSIGSSEPLPFAKATLDGIEAQQATNVLAQSDGKPYFLQVPFPDGGQWRTLNLAIESEAGGNASHAQASQGFRLLMHVSLTELGETWIDAGLSADRFRAILYFDRSATCDRVRHELADLMQELGSSGFDEVLLDVRSATALPVQQRKLSAAMQAGRPDSATVLDVKA